MKSLVYQDNYELPEGSIRISPSNIAKFNNKKWEWYQEQILGEKAFKGNTASVLGTCIHRIGEVQTANTFEDAKITPEAVKKEIGEYLKTEINNPDVNPEYILEQYPVMGNTLVTYLQNFGIPQVAERTLSYEILPNIFIAGTFDALLHDRILIDYKTTSDLNPKNYIPKEYKWQLLTYVWLCKQNGIEGIDTVRIIWITNNVVGRISEKTGKAMKDYPSQAVAVSELVTPEDMEWIDSYLHLIAETVQKAQEDPSLTYLLFSDYRLKESA